MLGMAHGILGLLALMGLTAVSPMSAQPIAWQAAPGSWIHIDGRAGPIAFRCSTEHADGTFRPAHARRAEDPRRAEDTKWAEDSRGVNAARPVATARVAIDGLQCGIEAMNHDLQVALRADRHPHITVEISELPVGTREYVVGRGTLSLAGVDRPIVGSAQVHHEQATIILSGEVDIDTERHGVELPRPLGGLVRVSPHMRVSYRLLIRYDPTEVLAPPATAPRQATVDAPSRVVR